MNCTSHDSIVIKDKQTHVFNDEKNIIEKFTSYSNNVVFRSVNIPLN